VDLMAERQAPAEPEPKADEEFLVSVFAWD
jgi:hypothetical protein